MAMITIDDEMIRRALDALRQQPTFTTAEVTEKITGQPYRVNKKIHATWSPNARLGTRLSEMEAASSSGFRRIEEENIKDPDGNRSKTMRWEWV